MARKRPKSSPKLPPEAPPMPPTSPPKLKSKRQMVAIDRARYAILSRIAHEEARTIAKQVRKILDDFFRARGIEPPANNGPGV